MMSAAMSGLVRGRPLRLVEESYLRATRRRYRRKIVSGVATLASAASCRRPRRRPFTARFGALHP